MQDNRGVFFSVCCSNEKDLHIPDGDKLFSEDLLKRYSLAEVEKKKSIFSLLLSFMNYLHMGKLKNLNTKGTVLWPEVFFPNQ